MPFHIVRIIKRNGHSKFYFLELFIYQQFFTTYVLEGDPGFFKVFKLYPSYEEKLFRRYFITVSYDAFTVTA